MMKSTSLWATALSCLTILLANAGHAGETMRNGEPIDPNRVYSDGDCTCYCPVVKYKPVYSYEKKCYQEAYQVPRVCCRYVPEYYTKTFCRQVPEYYTKTFCRQVPEKYTVCDTKYRNKYYTVTHCSYTPCRYVVKKCGVCPTDVSAPCGENECGVEAPCDSGSCSVARPIGARFARPQGAPIEASQDDSFDAPEGGQGARLEGRRNEGGRFARPQGALIGRPIGAAQQNAPLGTPQAGLTGAQQ